MGKALSSKLLVFVVSIASAIEHVKNFAACGVESCRFLRNLGRGGRSLGRLALIAHIVGNARQGCNLWHALLIPTHHRHRMFMESVSAAIYRISIKFGKEFQVHRSLKNLLHNLDRRLARMVDMLPWGENSAGRASNDPSRLDF